MDIAKLVYSGQLVGYRFTTGSKRYDVDVETVNGMGISLDGMDKSIELRQVGDLLMSKTEIERGKVAVDVSNNTSKLNELMKLLKSNEDAPVTDIAEALESVKGYSWEGMQKITKAEALERFNNDQEVYRLYDDGTEGLVESLGDIEDENFNDYEFGYEVKTA
jgi:hypothetical protein